MATTGVRFRGSSSLSELKNYGEEDKKASDKAKYSCGCLAAIKFVGSALGSVLYGKKTIEDNSGKKDPEFSDPENDAFDFEKMGEEKFKIWL